MINSIYNIGDTVKIEKDEDIENALKNSNVDWDAIYTITAVSNCHGISHYTLRNDATGKIIPFNDTSYNFIDGELLSYQDDELTNEKINALEAKLEDGETIEFKYNGLFYEIFESVSSDGYVVNVYSSDEKDKDGNYLDDNLVDGGLCNGGAEDAILFML